MVTRVVTTCLIVGVMTLALPAQQSPAGQPAAEAKPQSTPPFNEVKRRNVSIEVTITDQIGSAEPAKKLVTMIVADRHMGSVRSSGNVMAQSETPPQSPIFMRMVSLNVDASPVVHPDDSILLSLTLEYVPRPGGKEEGTRAELNERIAVTLESGKAMVISRAADPGSNRKIGIEVTATVMK